MGNLVGQGPIAAPMATSETVGTSIGAPELGSRWKDVQGNEFVVVDCQQAFIAGEFVAINPSSFAASRLAPPSTTSADVGVITANVTASDTKAYAQIYGVYAGAAGTSAVATSNFLQAHASWCDIGVVDGTPSSGAGATLIYNAYALTAADSATTSPASSFVTAAGTSSTAIGFSVVLKYPYILNTVNYGGTS